jgi:4a-hydroxytetrahydrobiopterin dehydratase
MLLYLRKFALRPAVHNTTEIHFVRGTDSINLFPATCAGAAKNRSGALPSAVACALTCLTNSEAAHTPNVRPFVQPVDLGGLGFLYSCGAIQISFKKGAAVAALSKQEIQRGMGKLQGWSYVGDQLQKKFTFKSFLAGIEFVNKIAQAAESAGHHPDITINYNVVGISLSTHSEGGITEKDFSLANKIDQVHLTLS